jgi:hypothetical protein
MVWFFFFWGGGDIEHNLCVLLYNFCLQHFSFYEEFGKILYEMCIGHHVNYPLFLWHLNETWIFLTDFQQNIQILHNENLSSRSWVVPWRWTDIVKLIVAFSSFSNALKHLWESSAGWFFSKLWICPLYSYLSMKYIQWRQSHFFGYSVKTWNSTSHSEEVLRRCGKTRFFKCSRACTQVRKHSIQISGENKWHSSVLCGSQYSVLPPLSCVALKKTHHMFSWPC